jgi:SAM-dependent methyltransferase
MRRDRAARSGVETFLYDRAFDDCLDRLADIRASFADVLLAGCPNPQWPAGITSSKVDVIDPGPLMAAMSGGQCADLEALPFDSDRFDLVISIGLLDTANNLALATAALNFVLKPGGLLLGAVTGGDSFQRLRKAMLAADAVIGEASPHVHPRIDAPGLAQLLASAGFTEPVVDVDRVELSYGQLDSLVRDLRAMGSTNILNARSRRPISRKALDAARSAFIEGGKRAAEAVEILHFAAWKPTSHSVRQTMS